MDVVNLIQSPDPGLTVPLPNPPRSPSAPLPPVSNATHRSSSATSSPRRPRRAGTSIPVSGLSEDPHESDLSTVHVRSARDEFEEHFLNPRQSDGDAKMINEALRRVDFRQIDDDEEDALSGDEAQKNSENDYDEFDTIDLQRIRQSTVRTNWRRIPSEVGCEGCEGCDRLCGENRKLRRQLDELEFELASGVLHNPSDGFDPPELVKAVPQIPQIPVSSKKKRGWTAKLRNSTAMSLTNSRPSERARLKSEVRALTVTTEYLWRKLNKAEMELRNYRLKELRNRMKTAGKDESAIVAFRSGTAVASKLRSAEWEWE